MGNWVYIIIGLALLLIVSICYIYYDVIKEKFALLVKNRLFNLKLYGFVRKSDYLLLTNIWLPIGDTSKVKVDNIVFGNKYIYLITSRTWVGAIRGKANDEKWILENKETMYVNNPLLVSRKKLDSLCTEFNIELDSVVDIVTFANIAILDNIHDLENNEFVLQNKDVVATIKKIERSSRVNDFNGEEIEKVARAIKDQSDELKNV